LIHVPILLIQVSRPYSASVRNVEAALSVMLKPYESVRITGSTLVPRRLARLVVVGVKAEAGVRRLLRIQLPFLS
jgi:hypothetical protein